MKSGSAIFNHFSLELHFLNMLLLAWKPSAITYQIFQCFLFVRYVNFSKNSTLRFTNPLDSSIHFWLQCKISTQFLPSAASFSPRQELNAKHIVLLSLSSNTWIQFFIMLISTNFSLLISKLSSGKLLSLSPYVYSWFKKTLTIITSQNISFAACFPKGLTFPNQETRS